jgi:hypothetical protein
MIEPVIPVAKFSPTPLSSRVQPPSALFSGKIGANKTSTVAETRALGVVLELASSKGRQTPTPKSDVRPQGLIADPRGEVDLAWDSGSRRHFLSLNHFAS